MLKRYGLPTFYLLIVFLCGVAVGGFALRFYQMRTVNAGGFPARPPEEWKKKHLAEMRSRLHLDNRQVDRLSGILDDTRSKFRAIAEKTRPEMDAIQAEQYAQVKAILTPQQAAEYEKYHAEREKQRLNDRRKF